MHVSQTSDQTNALRERVSGDVVPTSGQKDRLDESASSSERAVAAREAEAEDKVMDALAARIGERVMTKLSHMTDRIVDVLAERVAAKVMQLLTEMEQQGYIAHNDIIQKRLREALRMRVLAIRHNILLVLWSTELL
jgi:hypothetical protein